MTEANPDSDSAIALPPEPELRRATSALRENRTAEAEQILRRFLNENPENVNALKMLADVAIQFEFYGDAEELLTARNVDSGAVASLNCTDFLK